MATTANALEMYLDTDKKITKETLQQLHKGNALSANRYTLSQYTLQIVNILGGIEFILNICLNSNEITLTDTYKLETIYQILTTKPIDTNQYVITPKIINNIDIKKENSMTLEYIFDINNTFLHSMLSPPNAYRIRKLVEHNIIITLLIITPLIAFALTIVFGNSHLISSLYNITIFFLFYIPWLTFKHLLFNKNAFKLCLKTFDYWIKVCYGIIFIISGFFYENHPNITNWSLLTIIRHFLYTVFAVLGISFISSFDAFNMNKKKKLVLCIFVVLLFTFWAIACQFLLIDESDYKIGIQLQNGIHIISMISLLSTSSKVLCIFFWRQTINTFRRKGKTISLSIPPIIKWINGNDKTENNNGIEVLSDEGTDEINDTDITKEIIQKLHKENMLSKHYYISPQHAVQIVEIFGGIDFILSICLNSNETLIGSDKSQKLYTILTANAAADQSVLSTKIMNNSKSMKEDAIQFEYIFDVNNTFLHSILGETIGYKIKTFIEHKLVITSLIITFIISLVLRSVMEHYVYDIVIMCFFIIPWLVLKHLLFNKNAFKLCLKSFNYWMKVSYGIIYAIATDVYDNHSDDRDTVSKIRLYVYVIFAILVISFISSFDAFNMKKIKKLVLCGICVASFCWWVVRNQFILMDESDYKIQIQLQNGIHIISMISLMSGSSKVLCIFFWRQIINTYRRERKAISLSYTPTIEWINSNEKQNDNNSDQLVSEINNIVNLNDETSEINMQCVSKKPQYNRNVSVSIDDFNIDEQDEQSQND